MNLKYMNLNQYTYLRCVMLMLKLYLEMKLPLMIFRGYLVKCQTNFDDQRKAYLSAESIQRSISEVYEDGENQFDILKEDAFSGIRTTYYDDYDTGYRR